MEIPLSTETGQIGIMHLKRYWSKALAKIKGNTVNYPAEWHQDKAVLNALSVGLQPTLKYLHHANPDFNAFENWIIKNTAGFSKEQIIDFNEFFSNPKYKPQTIEKDLSIFSDEDWAFWTENGYFIIREAVSKQDCKDAILAIEEFLNIDTEDPKTWYQSHPERNGIMVEFFQNAALHKNRHGEKIKAVYQQLWRRTDLWVTTDRVSFNPPETSSYTFPGPNLHWDVSLQLPIPFGLQGLLYLSDTQETQGAFTLAPGFQNRIENWLNDLPKDAHPRQQDLYQLGIKPIGANAGDFIIWHHALPHGSSPNTSKLPRIVQYINYAPIDEQYHQNWI